MIRTLALILVVLLVPMMAVAATDNVEISFQWDTNPEQDDVDLYRIYRSTTSGDYTSGEQVVEVTEVPAEPTQQGVDKFAANSGQSYYWVVTAVDSNGYESDWSNEVTWRYDVPNTPGNVIIVEVKVTVPTN